MGLSSDYNEITANINSLEGPVDEWYVLHGKLKGLFGKEYAIKVAVPAKFLLIIKEQGLLNNPKSHPPPAKNY